MHAERTSLSMGNFVRVWSNTWGVSDVIVGVLSRVLRYIVIPDPDALIEHVTRVYMKAR